MKLEFLYRKYTFIVWKWLKIFYSKYCPSLAIHFPTCLAINGCHAKKTVALLRQTSHRGIFVHFRKKWSAGQKVRVPSMQINSNRTEPSLVSKPRAKVFSNWTLQSFPCPVLLYVMVRYHEAKLLCVALFDILVVLHAKLDSNRSFIVGSAQYWRFGQVLTAHNRSHPFDPTKHVLRSSRQNCHFWIF